MVEDPLDIFIATCTAEITHFSGYALVAPLDSDRDGMPDLFGELQDGCPFDPLFVSPDLDGFLPPVGGADEPGSGFDDPLKTFRLGRTVPIEPEYTARATLSWREATRSKLSSGATARTPTPRLMRRLKAEPPPGCARARRSGMAFQLGYQSP